MSFITSDATDPRTGVAGVTVFPGPYPQIQQAVLEMQATDASPLLLLDTASIVDGVPFYIDIESIGDVSLKRIPKETFDLGAFNSDAPYILQLTVPSVLTSQSNPTWSASRLICVRDAELIRMRVEYQGFYVDDSASTSSWRLQGINGLYMPYAPAGWVIAVHGNNDNLDGLNIRVTGSGYL